MFVLWLIKILFLALGLLVGLYLVGFAVVGAVALIWRHYHLCRHNELSVELEWHQYALLWPLFFAQMIVLAPKDIRRYIRYWRHRCQDFWTGLTSS